MSKQEKMRKQKRTKRVRSRFLAGIFCLSLFFADLASVAPVWAQEEAAPETEQSVQEEIVNSASENSAEEEVTSGEGADKNEEQNPAEGDNGGETQNPGAEDAGDPENAEEEAGEAGDAENAEEEAGDVGDSEDMEESGDTEEADAVSENSLNAATAMPLAASESVIASGAYKENGSDTTWVIDRNGKLTIAGTGEFAAPEYLEKNYLRLPPWYDYAAQIKTAEVRVTGMTDASHMFYECDQLTEVDLRGFDTSTVRNMNSTFAFCRRLKSLDVSGFDTSQVTTMHNMFLECRALTSLDVSGFDTSNVKDLSGMFDFCNHLTSLDVSHFDTSAALDTSYMFASCEVLESLDVSNFVTTNVTDMSWMFSQCEKLTRLDVSSFHTAKVTNMERMFGFSCSLTSLDLSRFDTSYVTNMNEMFCACEKLESLDMSGCDLGSLKKAEDFFAATDSLKTIYTPSSLQISVTLPEKGKWYQANGTAITELPKGLAYSTLITRDKKPENVQASITATKAKTTYRCGDTLNVDDITVRYQTEEGIITTLTTGFTTNAAEIAMNTPGEKTLTVTYTPSGGTPLTTEIKLRVTLELTAENVRISLPQAQYPYTAMAQKPVPAVILQASGEDADTLTAGSDYEVSYRNNIHAGEAAEVIITGKGVYSGSVTQTFTISKAPLTIKADDMTVGKDEELAVKDYPYSTALLGNDTLVTEPTFTFTWTGEQSAQADGALVDTSRIGSYTVTPKGAAAGDDYGDITYVSGTLTVAEERVVYTVSFDLMGHGTNFTKGGIKSGSLLELTEAQRAPEAEGYLFAGWYKDKGFAAKSAWDFGTDTVQGDMTLYACWLTDGTGNGGTAGGLKLFVQEIPDLVYTGSALKPAVTVYDSDKKTLLKAGKDYTVKYANNINVKTGTDGKPLQAGGTAKVEDPGKAGEKITSVIGTFTKDCPYVIITGKGNYAETIYQNFRILPADIAAASGADAQGNTPLAAGFTLKYTDQFEAKAGKYAKIINAFKYKKALKADQDYTYTVQDETGAAVTLDNKGQLPLNAGTYTLAVTGKGNYAGSIERKLYVSEKQKLIKNAAVTLGKNQKSRPYTGEDVALTPGYYDAAAKKNYRVPEGGTAGGMTEADAKDIFLVKAGKTSLLWNRDYTVSYTNNRAVGTATMTITGIGEYRGTKSVTFQITGTAFSAKTIDVKTSADQTDEKAFKATMPYTGRAVTQNKVTLTTKVTKSNPAAAALTYGKHYTISYKNNIKKGTATMTFTAKPESGYTGKFNKTFKIGQQYLSEDMFLKTNSDGVTVKRGVTDIRRDEKKHTVTVKWDEDAVHAKGGASLSFVLKNEKGDELKQGTDYTVSYKDNKAATKKSAGAGITEGSKQPIMTIKGKGNYTGTLQVEFQILPASIASEHLTVTAAQVQRKDGMKLGDFKLKVTDGKTALKAGVDYTVDENGCTPQIIQTYADALAAGTTAPAPKAVLKGIGNYETTREILLSDYIYLTKFTAKNIKVEVTGDRTYTGQNIEPSVKVSYYKDNDAQQQGAVGTELTAGKDYAVTYGTKNIAAGKNKGSITITGTGTYGGSVTVKFDIGKKAVY